MLIIYFKISNVTQLRNMQKSIPPRFAYYRFVSITKDFVKVYALIFFYFSSWVESFKIFDEQQDL